MKRFLPAAVLAGLILVGCGNADPYGKYNLGASQAVVARSIDSIGGLDAWTSIGQVQANVVMAIYDARGQHVTRQKQLIDINGGSIEATGSTASSQWNAQVRDDGRQLFSGNTANGPTSYQIIAALRTELHRLRGPLNLLGRGEKTGDMENMFVGGNEVTRVLVSGGMDDVTAYYFSVKTGQLLYITCGATKPGKGGSITAYEYVTLSSGLVFPRSIKVYRIGDHVLLGDSLIMEADFSDISIK